MFFYNLEKLGKLEEAADSRKNKGFEVQIMKTLFYGGNILTMEENLYTQALLVKDDKILAVGPEADLRAMAGKCEEVNLYGATLMPGFIDAHSHFSQMASAQLQISLEGADTVEEMGRRIGIFLEKHKPAPGQWVTARDYDKAPPFPTLEELDSFAPKNPLVIHHKSGHMGFLNSLGLEALDITPQTQAPEGGRIETKDGKLTGYLEENAFVSYLKKIPMAPPEELLQAYAKAQEIYASYGITTIQDGMIVRELLPLYHMLIGRKLLKLDLVAYPEPDTYPQAREELGKASRHLRIGGMKIFLDGSPQGRTAWMRRPYAGSDDYRGYGTMTDEAVKQAMEKAAREETQLLAHCNGDAAAEQFLSCLEAVEESYPKLKDLRPVIVHGQLMGRDQLPKAAALGAMVSFFVAHVYHWGDVHVQNFGMDRASCISPARSALEQGVPITFHQDAPVIQPDMLETVWCACNRVTSKGVKLGQEECISVLDALKAITVNAAYQYFQEDRKGTLAPGKCADLVVLSRDPLQTPREELDQIQVLETWKDGERVYQK